MPIFGHHFSPGLIDFFRGTPVHGQEGCAVRFGFANGFRATLLVRLFSPNLGGVRLGKFVRSLQDAFRHQESGVQEKFA